MNIWRPAFFSPFPFFFFWSYVHTECASFWCTLKRTFFISGYSVQMSNDWYTLYHRDIFENSKMHSFIFYDFKFQPLTSAFQISNWNYSFALIFEAKCRNRDFTCSAIIYDLRTVKWAKFGGVFLIPITHHIQEIERILSIRKYSPMVMTICSFSTFLMYSK